MIKTLQYICSARGVGTSHSAAEVISMQAPPHTTTEVISMQALLSSKKKNYHAILRRATKHDNMYNPTI